MKGHKCKCGGKCGGHRDDDVMGMVRPILGAGVAIQMLPLLKPKP